MKFDELNIDERILRAVEDMGFEETSPIQTQAIPAVLEGIDVIGQAQTGILLIILVIMIIIWKKGIYLQQRLPLMHN
jgi:superfamily II helicase